MKTTDIPTTEIQIGDSIAAKGRTDFREVAAIEPDGSGVRVLTFTKDSEPVVHSNPDRRSDQLRVRTLGQTVTRKENS